MTNLALASEFAVATRQQWRKLVTSALRGADLEERLVARTFDGLRVEPLFPTATPVVQPWRGGSGRWRIAQRVNHPTPETANELALADLEGGADALTLVSRGARAARGFGIHGWRTEELDRALANVMLDCIPLRVDAGHDGWRWAAGLLELAERRGHHPSPDFSPGCNCGELS